MGLLSHFLAERRVQRLKSAQSLDEATLRSLQDELVTHGASVIPALLESLSHGEARPASLAVLERLLSPETADTFVRALGSPNPAIVSGVSRILCESKNCPAVALLPALSQPGVSRNTLETILVARMENLPIERIVSEMDAYSRETQAMLMRAFERSLPEAHCAAILPLTRGEDVRIRASAARILSRFPSPVSEGALRGLLSDANKGVRLEAVNALIARKSTGAVPDLVPLLRDGDFKVQTAAIDALCALADDRAVPLLIAVLTDEVDTARRAAVEVLNAIATPEAIQDLVRALRDQDWWVRVRAADALGTLGGERVVQAVIGLLRDEDDFIRRHAIEVLNAVPNKLAVEPLMESLMDSDWWVRERAIDALGKTRDPRAIDRLARLMTEDPACGAFCARALGAIGHVDALDPLLAAGRSDHEETRNAAIEALKSFPQEGLDAAQKSGITDLIGRSNSPSGGGTHRPMRAHSRPERGEDAPRLATPASPAPVSPSSTPALNMNFANLEAGTTLLDRYRILRAIGRGGFGTVYLAEDQAISEDIILKVLNPQFSADESAERRFVLELKVTRKITHRNVIRIYDFLDLGGARAVSMEYFPGRDLGKLLAEESPLDPARSLRVIAQVCEGLAAAHAVGVVHRDIKPPNILVGMDDETRVVDFGLASAGQQSGSRLTKSGLLIGTPEYMAPEQISSEEVDHRCDIYSVGIVMYEMLTGVRPYTAETPVKVLFRHLEGEATPMASLAPHLPDSLIALTMSTMARHREDRPESAAVLHDRLLEECALLEKAA